MPDFNRRQMLRTILAGGATAVAGALATRPALAFTPPVPGRRYLKFGGMNFRPISTFKNGVRTDWTYNDNGSIFVTGTPTMFRARLQLPDGAVIEKVEFNYFLGGAPGMDFSMIAFDGANGYDPDIPSAHVENPDPAAIQTASLAGLPKRVNNSAWYYVLSWAPHAADPDHMLWGARVAYRMG
jgi:hypothetical protein